MARQPSLRGHRWIHRIIDPGAAAASCLAFARRRLRVANAAALRSGSCRVRRRGEHASVLGLLSSTPPAI